MIGVIIKANHRSHEFSDLRLHLGGRTGGFEHLGRGAGEASRGETKGGDDPRRELSGAVAISPGSNTTRIANVRRTPLVGSSCPLSINLSPFARNS